MHEESTGSLNNRMTVYGYHKIVYDNNDLLQGKILRPSLGEDANAKLEQQDWENSIWFILL